jgi:hypothetical protein
MKKSTSANPPSHRRRRTELEVEGGVTGALAGAAAGSLAGAPGAALGAVIGGVAGVLAGVAMDNGDADAAVRDAKLDGEIGVIGGDLGVGEDAGVLEGTGGSTDEVSRFVASFGDEKSPAATGTPRP